MAIVYRPTSSPESTRSQKAGLTQSYSTSVQNTVDEITEFWTREQAALFEQWASSFDHYNEALNNPYFDYFFSGEDINVTIEGLGDNEPINVTSFAYTIQQQKQPVYGFWSYTYDAMLRGTRIITGAFSVALTGPASFTQLVAKAARNRAKARRSTTIRDYHSIRGLDEDEANIEKYWRRHLDKNLYTNQQHLFSVHPPFNMMIQYGLQETSLVSNNPEERASEFMSKFNRTSVMAADYNERLVKNPTVQDDVRVLLENVELIGKQIQYDANGDPLVEIYSFMARDEVLLSDKVYKPIRAEIDDIRTNGVSYSD